MRAFARYSAVICCLSWLASGCERDPVNPGTGQIDIAVWRVLATGEQPGLVWNDGCRLTDSDILAYIEQLEHNVFIFGGGEFYLVYLDDIVDPGLLPFQSRTRKTTEFYQAVITRPENWLDDAINIYFVGNVQPTLSLHTEQWAESVDPADTVPNEPWPYILVNDGGWNRPDGFADDPARFRAFHILEHEMTHFLARFGTQQWFGGQYLPYRTYDENEHDLDMHGTAEFNILKWDPPHPLNIYGHASDGATEEGQIWARIIEGEWANP